MIGLSPTYGDVTDSGVIQLVPLCDYHFSSAFSPPGNYLPGPPYDASVSHVDALAVFDDGSGPALYAGGYWMGSPTPGFVAKWGESGWQVLGWFGSTVEALASFDDGAGARLYAGGSFTTAAGLAAARIASWDGTTWSSVGGGFDGTVYSLETIAEGGGKVLYAGGSFTQAGGSAAGRVARWDGTTWSGIGDGLDGAVRALAQFDDGQSGALYAGGDFRHDAVGTVEIEHVAKLVDGAGLRWAPASTTG